MPRSRLTDSARSKGGVRNGDKREGHPKETRGEAFRKVSPRDHKEVFQGSWGDFGETYPRAHEGDLLVVEAVHGAGRRAVPPARSASTAAREGGSRLGSGRCEAAGGEAMTGSESGSGPFRAGWVPAWDPQRVAAPRAVMSPNFYRNSRDITRGGERPRPRSAPLSRSPPSLPLLSAAGPQPGPFPRRPARPIHKLLPPPSSSFTPSPSRARPRSRAPPAIHTARPAPFISTAPAPGRAAPSRIEPPGPARTAGQRGLTRCRPGAGPGVPGRRSSESGTALPLCAGPQLPSQQPPPRHAQRRLFTLCAAQWGAGSRPPAPADWSRRRPRARPPRAAPRGTIENGGVGGGKAANGRRAICMAPPRAFFIHKKIEGEEAGGWGGGSSGFKGAAAPPQEGVG